MRGVFIQHLDRIRSSFSRQRHCVMVSYKPMFAAMTSSLPRSGYLVLLTSLLSGCAAQMINQSAPQFGDAVVVRPSENHDAEACRVSLERPVADRAAELDPNDIQLANWNIQKKRNAGWERDFEALARGKDLVLIQEASLRAETTPVLRKTGYPAFAPGYHANREITGVLTLSGVSPVTTCQLRSFEPLLLTPKATSITQYAIAGTDATLAVVNVHAINFSLGLNAFRGQFERIAEVLSVHRGPIILAGDFNTWRSARMTIITNITERLGLRALQFDEDHRTRFLGRPLDHIYVRGLTATAASTWQVRTSDHNPMSVTLSL